MDSEVDILKFWVEQLQEILPEPKFEEDFDEANPPRRRADD